MKKEKENKNHKNSKKQFILLNLPLLFGFIFLSACEGTDSTNSTETALPQTVTQMPRSALSPLSVAANSGARMEIQVQTRGFNTSARSLTHYRDSWISSRRFEAGTETDTGRDWHIQFRLPRTFQNLALQGTPEQLGIVHIQLPIAQWRGFDFVAQDPSTLAYFLLTLEHLQLTTHSRANFINQSRNSAQESSRAQLSSNVRLSVPLLTHQAEDRCSSLELITQFQKEFVSRSGDLVAQARNLSIRLVCNRFDQRLTIFEYQNPLVTLYHSTFFHTEALVIPRSRQNGTLGTAWNFERQPVDLLLHASLGQVAARRQSDIGRAAQGTLVTFANVHPNQFRNSALRASSPPSLHFPERFEQTQEGLIRLEFETSQRSLVAPLSFSIPQESPLYRALRTVQVSGRIALSARARLLYQNHVLQGRRLSNIAETSRLSSDNLLIELNPNPSHGEQNMLLP